MILFFNILNFVFCKYREQPNILNQAETVLLSN